MGCAVISRPHLCSSAGDSIAGNTDLSSGGEKKVQNGAFNCVSKQTYRSTVEHCYVLG